MDPQQGIITSGAINAFNWNVTGQDEDGESHNNNIDYVYTRNFLTPRG